MQNVFKKLSIISILVLMSSAVAFSQPPDPTNDPDVVPISGIEVLVGAGAILGIRRLWASKRYKS